MSSKLDAQLKSAYKLEVVATDRGIPQAKVNSTAVLIDVTDSSNSAPKFESVAYVGEIDEGLANQFVVSVKANDLDDGILGKITYSITGQWSRKCHEHVGKGIQTCFENLKTEQLFCCSSAFRGSLTWSESKYAQNFYHWYFSDFK